MIKYSKPESKFGFFFFFFGVCDVKDTFPSECVLCQDPPTGEAKFSPGDELNSSEVFLWTRNSMTLDLVSSPIWIFPFPSLAAPCRHSRLSPPGTSLSWSSSPLSVTSCQWPFFIKQAPVTIRLNKTAFISCEEWKMERKSK